MHSKVVRPALPAIPFHGVGANLIHMVDYHRIWSCRSYRSDLSGSSKPRACSFRGEPNYFTSGLSGLLTKVLAIQGFLANGIAAGGQLTTTTDGEHDESAKPCVS